MKSLTLVMMLLLALGIGGGIAAEPSGSGPARPPLPPEGIHVVPPDSGVPAEVKEFSGSWYGEWVDPNHPDRGIREILVVEKMISKDDIRVIFSWGDCPVCGSKAAYRRFTGKVVNICIDWQKLPKPFSQVNTDALGQKKVLFFSYPEGRSFTFLVYENDRLIGTDGVGAVMMRRLK